MDHKPMSILISEALADACKSQAKMEAYVDAAKQFEKIFVDFKPELKEMGKP